MKNNDLINKLTISELSEKYPFAENFFTENNLPVETFQDKTFHEFIVTFAEDKIEDFALDVEKIEESLVAINTILSDETSNSKAFFLSIPAFSISSIRTIGDELKMAVSAIIKIITTSPEEKKILKKLDEMDDIIQKMRSDLRKGEILKSDF